MNERKWTLSRVVGALWRRVTRHLATSRKRLSLASVGPRTIFQSGVKVMDPKSVTVGSDCYFWRGVRVSSELASGRLIVGNGVQINRDVRLDATGILEIADGVLLSEEVVIYTHDHGLDPRAAPRPIPKTIGSGAWIGMRAIILPGCQRIGVDSVIGAGAVVTKDVPDGTVVAGNPARVIGSVRDDTFAATAISA